MPNSIYLTIGAVACLAMTSCGGGGAPSSGSTGTSSRKTLAARQAAAAVQAARSEQSILGLVLKGVPGSSARSADTNPAALTFDKGTSLYYRVTYYPDGSGLIELFADAGGANPSGKITWDVPVWENGIAGSYPAHVTYHVQNVNGVSGPVTLTIQDARGTVAGAILMHLSRPSGETYDCTLDYADGSFQGTVILDDSDGQVDEQVDQSADGSSTVTTESLDPEGDFASIDMGSDAIDSVMVEDSQDDPLETEQVDQTGMDEIDFGDGVLQCGSLDDLGWIDDSGDTTDGTDDTGDTTRSRSRSGTSLRPFRLRR